MEVSVIFQVADEVAINDEDIGRIVGVGNFAVVADLVVVFESSE